MKKISTLAIILIIVVVAIVAIGGVFAYQYFTTKTGVSIVPTTQGPNFLLSISGNNVEIKDENTQNLIQEIPLNSEVLPYIKNLQIKDIASLNNDINFDGYKDLSILSQVPADNPGFYDYFLYNPSTKKFEADVVLKNLCSPSFNPTTKIITTYASEGCAGENFSEQTFSFINGNYALTQTKDGNCCSLSNNGGVLSVTVNNFENGKITATTQEYCPVQK